MSIPILCNINKIYRADCIKFTAGKNFNFFIKTYNHKDKYFFYLFLVRVILYSIFYKKICVVVDYWALKPLAILSSKKFISKKLIIDFYDIFSLRPTNPQLIDAKYEHRIIKNCEYFFARSFELKKYFNVHGVKGKKSIFFPDLKPIEVDGHNICKKSLNEIIFLGGIGPNDLYKLEKIDKNIKVNIYLAPDQEFFKVSKNIVMHKSINPSNFNSIVGGYEFAICLINEEANVFNISAASKYMVYLESNLLIITDPRHRMAKWYRRYFPDNFIFIDDRELDKINQLYLLSYKTRNKKRNNNNISFFISNIQRKLNNLLA